MLIFAGLNSFIYIKTILRNDQEKLVDIAIYSEDGEELITEINPESKLSQGEEEDLFLKNHDIVRSPKFYQLAKRIIQLTENKILIGFETENIYTILKGEFEQLGFDFKCSYLSIQSLVEKIFPEIKEFDFIDVCMAFQVKIENQKKSDSHCKALIELYQKLTKLIYKEKIEGEIIGIKEEAQIKISDSTIQSLPKKEALYKLFNKNHHLVYCGISNNLQQSISDLFDEKNQWANQILKEISSYISYDETGSELIGFLKQHEIISQKNPMHNKVGKKDLFSYGIRSYFNKEGYINLEAGDIINSENKKIMFTSLDFAKSSLAKVIDKYHLCPKLCNVYKTKGGCYNYGIGSCKGACVNEENPKEYNKRVDKALQSLSFKAPNFFVIDKGRNSEEKAIVLVERNKYKGFGYIPSKHISKDVKLLKTFIQPQKHDNFIGQMIRNYIVAKDVEQVIEF